ncbi:MAG TPA: hypothetical protein VK348_06320 [Planctomycetota bacterium]|nr:hypothetical protein [Planctomycetota bacterium]
MTRRLLLLILVPVLLLSVVMWLALAGSEAQPLPTAPAQEPELVTAEPGLAQRAVVEASATMPRADTLLRVEAAAESGDAPPIPADATWIEILVKDKASAQPVVGAEVSWINSATRQRLQKLPQDEETQWPYRDQDRLAARFGWHTRSDEHGVARVHLAEWCSVFARSGKLYGTLTIQKNTPPPASGYCLELLEDRTLLVQVVDAEGRPAPGVRIVVAQHAADGAFLGLQNQGQPVRAEKPDGMAKIAHMQQWTNRSQGNQVRAAIAEWRVRVNLPGYDDRGTAFDPKAPPAEPVVLHLPPTGSVVATVTYHGAAITSGVNIGLYVRGKNDANGRNQVWNITAGDDGVVRFPYVPLGGKYVATSRVDAANVEQEFTGPATADQEVSVQLRVADDNVVLTGRVLDEQRQPIGSSEFSVEYQTSQSGGGAQLHTDAQGRFRFFLQQLNEATDRLESFTIEWHRPDAIAMRASLPPCDLRPGVQDLGDLRLVSGSLVVAGRFMAGAEPYTTRVAFMVERWRDVGRNGRDVFEQVDGLTFNQVEGAFEVRGELGPGRYRLQFQDWNHLPVAPVEFNPGTRDLVVQIASGEQLQVTALLPPDLPWGVQAVLKADHAAPDVPDPDDPMNRYRFRGNRHNQADPQEQDPGHYRFQWQAMAAGTYSLEFRLWSVASPLLAIPGIVLPLAAPDRRLQDVDLRELVEVLTVRALDAAGKLIAADRRGGFVFQQFFDPAADWQGYQLQGGALRMPVRTGPADLLVTAVGFRPREVRGARGAVAVDMQPWPEVELVFADLPPLPEGFSLQASLRTPDPQSNARYVTPWSSGARSTFAEPPPMTRKVEGRITFPIGDSPRRLSVVLRKDNRGARAIEGVSPKDVGMSPAPVAVVIPAVAVQKALEALQK